MQVLFKIPPLEVLSIYAAFRSIVALLSKVLVAVGDPRFVMWNDLAALGVMPAAFYIGSHWGIVGIAWGWVAAYPLIASPLYEKTLKTIEMQAREYFRALRPALDGTLVMLTIVALLKWELPASQPLVLRLLLEVVTGVVAYISTLLALHRDRLLTLVRWAKGFRRTNVPA